MSSRVRRNAFLGAASLALLPSVSWAQAVPPAQPAQPASETQADAAPSDVQNGSTAQSGGDIVVTATKRAQRLQDVPISITALSSDVLEQNNARELDDVAKLTPGLTINYGTQPGNFTINMRGIGTFSTSIAAEADVATVIDDVPVAFQAAAFKDLADVERVEVLKGPQSTLFGKSAISGVLNITTKAPTDTWTGKATGLVTNDHEWRLAGTIAGPITDSLRVRLTAAKNDWDGNIYNLTTGRRQNGSEGFTVTGKIEWEPAPNLTFTLQPRYNEQNSTCCAYPQRSMTPGLFLQGIRSLPASLVYAGINFNDPFNTRIRQDERSGGDSSIWGLTFHASLAIPNGFLSGNTLTYIASADRYQLHDYQDNDASDTPFLLYFPVARPSGINSGTHTTGSFHARSLTQELRLTSPGNDRLNYVVGLWYARNYIDRYLDRGPVVSFVRYFADHRNANYSIYGDLTYNVSSKLSLLGGLRLNQQDISYNYYNYTATPAFTLRGNDKDTAVTTKVGLQYRPNRANTLYATFSTGYKGQAYDLTSTFNAAIAATMPVPAETAENYEVGAKNSLFNNKIYTNLSLFWTNYHNFQTSSSTALADGTYLTFLNSVGKLRTRGVEFDMGGKVSRNLSVNGSAAYIDARIIDFPYAPCYTLQTTAQGCVRDPRSTINIGNIQNLAGARLNNAPRFKFNVGANYSVPLMKTGVSTTLGLNYRWQSTVNYQLTQDPYTIQPSYGILDARAGFSANKSKYRVTFFMNNVLNKHYARGVIRTLNGFSAAGVSNAVGVAWIPARDAFRYGGIRLDTSF